MELHRRLCRPLSSNLVLPEQRLGVLTVDVPKTGEFAKNSPFRETRERFPAELANLHEELAVFVAENESKAASHGYHNLNGLKTNVPTSFEKGNLATKP